MRVDKYKESEVFEGEEGERLRVCYDNRGDPYSEGITLEFEDWGTRTSVYLEKREAKQLADLIKRLYP